MADAQVKAMAIIFAIAAVSAAFIGAGYAFDYYGTTSSHSQDVDVKYVVVEINDNTSGSLVNTFHFAGPKAYADTTIPGSTTYRTVAYTETSNAAKVEITGANTASVSMKVSLAQPLPTGATATIQFYNADQSQTVGPSVALSTSETVVTTLTTATEYYCKITLTMDAQSGLASAPSGFDLDVTFVAYAEA